MQDSKQIADTIRERLSMISDEQTKLASALDALSGRTYNGDDPEATSATPPRKRGRPKGSRTRTKATALTR